MSIESTPTTPTVTVGRPEMTPTPANVLTSKRLTLRPLRASDFASWSEVRLANKEWLVKWDPQRPASEPDVERDPQAFAARCAKRDADRIADLGYSFGVFVNDSFAGEMNLITIQRGSHQSTYVGYWIDGRHAGKSYTPEALAAVMHFGFEQLKLHRVQISIVPHNTASIRVVEKLDVRLEGRAERYMQINGVWEDHLLFAMTSEEWASHKADYEAAWLTKP